MILRSRQRGFAYIAAVIFLVALAAFALAILRLQNAQQATVDGGILGMRAGQAARGGLEWAFYRLRSGDTAICNAIGDGSAKAGTTLNSFMEDTGFKVTVTCRFADYREGQDPASSGTGATSLVKHIFELEATACNGAGAACPDAASVPSRDYVERKRAASICAADKGAPCY